MLLYSTNDGLVLERGGHAQLLAGLSWDEVFRADDPAGLVLAAAGRPVVVPDPGEPLRAPVASQEIWAAGVTYFRSRSARMDESKEAGASVF
jgi:2-dehydro-3-deoxy-D-arabinonate dehydratase